MKRLIVTSRSGEVFQLGSRHIRAVYPFDIFYSETPYSASRKWIGVAMRTPLYTNYVTIPYRSGLRHRRKWAVVTRYPKSIKIGCQHFYGTNYKILRKWALSQ